ncbi:hypothetical protein CRUP_012610 [Coryphaenoides rupestris]|nr:hypothetical protein CRUP_012610 [Coryphaenoides rupestris]
MCVCVRVCAPHHRVVPCRAVLFEYWTSHWGGYCHEAVLHALNKCGVRHIDTAKRYGCEEELGQAVRESGVPRGDLWLTNKLWPGDYGHSAAKKACLDSCSRMGVDYFDLYLMHWPESKQQGRSNREVRAETWRALEELYDEGHCPLAKGQTLADPTVLKLAEKYGRTPAQICIRWSLQVLGFQLEEGDMAALGQLHDGRHASWDPTHLE